jgi:ribonuclease-3
MWPPSRVATNGDPSMTEKPVERRGEIDLEGLETALAHRFENRNRLLRALTHRSMAKELALESETSQFPLPGDNERLEYLGDAVLGLVVAEALFKAHPKWQEGELTRVRAQLVSREHIASVAAAIDLGSYLRVSRGEDHGGLRRRSTVLSNTMEAVLGALYLDAGLEPVRAFVRLHVMGETAGDLAEESRTDAALGNYKSALQEYLQSTQAGVPFYKIKGESGPDHRKRFLVEVRVKAAEDEPGRPLGRGIGNSKKSAEQNAARHALAKLMAAAAEAEPQAVSEPAVSESDAMKEE